MHYLDQQGNYYIGEKPPGSITVLERPSTLHILKAAWKTCIPDVWEFDLSLAKEAATKAVDITTSSLISQGFTFDGKVFSLSDNAQRKLLILQNLIAMGALDPTTPMSALDESTYLLARAQAQAFVAAGYTRLSSLIQSGTELKGQIMAATSEEAINAIEDTRE